MTPTSDLDQSEDLKQNGHDLQQKVDEELKKLLKEMPQLKEVALIKPVPGFFQKLSNLRFAAWYSFIRNPATKIEVVISPKTMEYIENRRQELGLDKAPTKEQEKEKPYTAGQN